VIEEKDGWKKVNVLDPDDANRATGTAAWAKAENLEDHGGVIITSEAFETVIGGFKYILSIAVILFAFSTMISWSYYGEQAVIFLFGRNQVIVVLYKIVFCVICIFGASASLGNVIRISDSMIFAMAIPNLIGLYFLLPFVKEELRSYLDHVKKN